MMCSEKSACPFGQVKTKMYLPESPFFKNSLARASGLVLMLVPDMLVVILFFLGKLFMDQALELRENLVFSLGPLGMIEVC